MMNKETMVVNAIRILSAEAVQKAKSGPPGHAHGRCGDGICRMGTRNEA